MEIKLSNRLSTVTGFIKQGCGVADIGTDHGYIPVLLAQKGGCRNIIASDLRNQPLENAKEDAKRYHVEDKISFRLSFGLNNVMEEEVDCIIMAGMGGNTIIDIINADPWSLKKHLILQPQTQIPELRQWLKDKGMKVDNAALAQDSGRFYVVWSCVRGEDDEELNPFSLICDNKIVENKDPLLVSFCENVRKKYIHILNGMKKSGKSTEDEIKKVRCIIDAADSIVSSNC